MHLVNDNCFDADDVFDDDLDDEDVDDNGHDDDTEDNIADEAYECDDRDGNDGDGLVICIIMLFQAVRIMTILKTILNTKVMMIIPNEMCALRQFTK